MRPNWFFAFPVAGEFVRGLPAPPSGLRLEHPDDLHLTLAFLGGVGEEAARRALALLDERLAVEPLAALEFNLAQVVPMGSPRSFSALAALPGEGARELHEALGRLRDPLTEAASGRKDKRAPKPHVTLGRPLRAADEAQRRGQLAWAASLELSPVRLRATSVALYTWSPIRRPRRFCIVEERALEAS